MKSKSYDPKQVVGNYFEKKTMEIFDLVKTNDIKLPDLISKNDSFYVEVKASNTNAVIKGRQLEKHLKVQEKRFFAVWFHGEKLMKAKYKTKEELINGLNITGKKLYMFPMSIMNAYYKTALIENNKYKGDFTRFRRNDAKKVFSYDIDTWNDLNLKIIDYKRVLIPQHEVNILTKKGDLEEKILKSFHPEFLYP